MLERQSDTVADPVYVGFLTWLRGMPLRVAPTNRFASRRPQYPSGHRAYEGIRGRASVLACKGKQAKW